MAKYDITTRRCNDGSIRTKYNLDGSPARLTDIDPKYVKIGQIIANAHRRILNLPQEEKGDLEKMTTTFEVTE